ncbi:MAG: deoxyribodipyrimidine photo-lyase [Ectothiorhodospiraceae bacterium]|nr:deoxyribodipyrimidine photo-lyase [Ectothiorhodospiraceae bacterium]
MTAPTIVWLRRDLRLADNPALAAAARRGGAVLPVYVHAPEEEAPWQPGAASRVWLHHSLGALDAALRRAGSRLLIRQGPSRETLDALVRETGAGSVLWNRLHAPTTIARDTEIRSSLRERGIDARSFDGALLHEPQAVKTRTGTAFRVFTPFWKTCQSAPPPPTPLPVPSRLPPPSHWPDGVAPPALGLLPRHDWCHTLAAHWTIGEAGALARLARFVTGAAAGYGDDRDRPDLDGCSRLSPHLHFGEISPRQVWHAVHDALGTAGAPYLRQLWWREFAHHLLFHAPHTTDEPLQSRFRDFPWRGDPEGRVAWQRGRTGYPLVDAGMRELWATGWMHNRVRMNVASFLVKHLLLPWTDGARWFWDTLVDADLANNTLGWQWTAGCGADAAPYFRVFNPVLQGERFDPSGDYVRRWVPELGVLPARWIHQPWAAPAEVLETAGIRLGTDYPRPLVDHAFARGRALEALASISGE